MTIKNVNMLKDGGSIKIEAFFADFEREIVGDYTVYINCTSFGGDNTVWFGAPYKNNSTKIEDKELLKDIKEALENYNLMVTEISKIAINYL